MFWVIKSPVHILKREQLYREQVHLAFSPDNKSFVLSPFLTYSCAADFSLLNLPKGQSLGRSKPATSSYAQAPQNTVWETSTISKPYWTAFSRNKMSTTNVSELGYLFHDKSSLHIIAWDLPSSAGIGPFISFHFQMRDSSYFSCTIMGMRDKLQDVHTVILMKQIDSFKHCSCHMY
jgi:hypothetical protein